MLIETKARVIRFFQKIANSKPTDTIRDFEGEALELEMELRKSYRMPHTPRPWELEKTIMNLSNEQKEHYESISWLMNPMGPRGSGRSHLLALSFIEHSLFYRIWIRLSNHGDHPYADKEILALVKKIMSSLKGLHLQVKRKGNITEIKVSRNCTEHMPTWRKIWTGNDLSL